MDKNLTEKPEISILMTNYNNSKYIGESIQSVLNQTYKNWELIIIDDCSTDNSLIIIKQFLGDKRIKLIINEKNIGCVGTSKKLVKSSSADILAILDSDDTLNNDALEVIMNAYKENPNCGFIYSQFIICDENLNPLKKGFCKTIPVGRTNLHERYTSHFKTFKREDYLKTNGYDLNILVSEDKDMILKLEEVTKLFFIDKPLYFYRILPNSESHGQIKSPAAAIYFIIAKYKAYKRRIGTKIPNISAKEMSYYLFLSSAIALKIKSYRYFRKLFALAIKISPFNLKGYIIFLAITIKYILTLPTKM